MVNKNKKRVMITLSNQVLDLLDEITRSSGESYSDYFTRIIIAETLERKRD